MARYFHPDADWFRKLNLTAPDTKTHGTEDDIEKNLKKLMPNDWRLEGNKLIGRTEFGPLVQTIDPAYILTGMDGQGLPIFKRVDV